MKGFRTTITAAMALGLLAAATGGVTAQEEVAAPEQLPVEFTGHIECGPPVAYDRAGRTTTVDVGDEDMVLSRFRRGAWSQAIDVTDPRLHGDVYETWESDTYALPGSSGPEIQAYTRRIENEDGAWESVGYRGTYPDGTSMAVGPVVLVGQGAYEGLTALFEITGEEPPCTIEIRGVIFEDAPVPEPYRPE